MWQPQTRWRRRSTMPGLWWVGAQGQSPSAQRPMIEQKKGKQRMLREIFFWWLKNAKMGQQIQGAGCQQGRGDPRRRTITPLSMTSFAYFRLLCNSWRVSFSFSFMLLLGWGGFLSLPRRSCCLANGKTQSQRNPTECEWLCINIINFYQNAILKMVDSDKYFVVIVSRILNIGLKWNSLKFKRD